MGVHKSPGEGEKLEEPTSKETALAPPRFIHVEIQRGPNSFPVHYLLHRIKVGAEPRRSPHFGFKLWRWSNTDLRLGEKGEWIATGHGPIPFPTIRTHLTALELSQILARQVASLLRIFRRERPTLIEIIEEVKDDRGHTEPKVVVRTEHNIKDPLPPPTPEGEGAPGVILRMVRSAPPDGPRGKISKAKGYTPEVTVYIATTAKGVVMYLWNRSGPSRAEWTKIGKTSLPLPPLTASEINSREIPPLETVLFLLPDILASSGITSSDASEQAGTSANPL